LINNHEKITKHNDSYIAHVGHAQSPLAFRHFFRHTKKRYKLHSVDDIYEFSLDFHQHLKKELFLEPMEDRDDEYESLRLESLRNCLKSQIVASLRSKSRVIAM